MKLGICALCGKSEQLQESHFLPKALYRLMRESTTSNKNPVLISRTISTQKSHQMTQPLLCKGCEHLFCEHGERYVLPLLHGPNGFALLDRLKLALPLHVTASNAIFSCSSVGFEGEKIGYFGLSVLWRAAVRPWRTFEGDTTSIQLDAAYMESIRAYLAGEAGYPKNVVVSATVATDFLSQRSCFVPFRVTENTQYVAYGLLTKGLFYRFIMEDNPPPELQAISCCGPGPNLIFANDCSEKSQTPFAKMMETSVPKGQLADTHPTTGFAKKMI